MSMAGVFLLNFFVVLLFQLDAVLASVEECQRVPQKLIVGYAPFSESHVLVQLVGAQFAHEHWQVALVNYLGCTMGEGKVSNYIKLSTERRNMK